ncbi:tyrosine--tRNA ligase [Salininema proteolyticum]|uniref:Tyrosine--tRNA ligase n=1 Tax=Salininema proteolyticum TaxID=1607685 RepID=A0ABV8U1K4_9ACTN
MDIIDDLTWRGLIQDSTDPEALREAVDAGGLSFYVGFDPTAESLHVGHLTQVLTARRLQAAGLRPHLLVGGATGQIGDPRQTSERNLNSPETVAGWVKKIQGQIEPFLDFEGSDAAVMVNNLDWTSGMDVISFLRDVGKHFSVSKMINREVVRARLETGISFTEFSYQLLQSNDYYQLNERYGVSLQFGGSDQWGNITAGVDFVRRSNGKHVHAFVTPLVLKADGTKFGKTAGGGNTWLSSELTSPYAFYQFWINADDRDVAKYLRYFSFKSREEIEELEEATREKPAARLAQRALAEELTTLLHGAEECADVQAASKALFGRGELAELPEPTLRSALAEAGLAEAGAETTVAQMFKDAGVVGSLGEARRAAKEGGVYVNNERVTEVNEPIASEKLLHGRYAVLRRGKKTVAGAEVTSR